MRMRAMRARGCSLAVLGLAMGVSAEESKEDMPAWMDTLPEQKELPDPFLKPDGKRVRTIEEWDTQRKHLKGLLLKYKHGEVPEDNTLAVSGKVDGNATGQTNGTERIDAVLTVKTQWKETSAAGDARTAPERTLQFKIHIFRPLRGGHGGPIVFERWLEFADWLFNGEARKADFRHVPHPELKRNFSWQAPSTDHRDPAVR